MHPARDAQNVPTAQREQLGEPAGEAVPRAQDMQGIPSADGLYLLAAHCAHCVAPVGASKPAAQGRHWEAPTKLANVAAPQAVQLGAPDEAANRPTAHGEQALAPDRDVVPGLQLAQLLEQPTNDAQ